MNKNERTRNERDQSSLTKSHRHANQFSKSPNTENRSYLNDDYSRYSGSDYQETPSRGQRPYDMNESFSNSEFKFDREEFGQDESYNRFSEDQEHPGVSGSDRWQGSYTNRDRYNDQQKFLEQKHNTNRRERPETSWSNETSYERNDQRNPYGQSTSGRNDYGTAYAGQSGSWPRGQQSWRSEQRSENFIGKGPKGYKRSGDRIREEVCEALSRHPRLDASDIEVSVKEGTVNLTGTVSQRQDKRMAEDVIENILGVEDIHNELKVKRNDESWGSTRTGMETKAENKKEGERLKGLS